MRYLLIYTNFGTGESKINSGCDGQALTYTNEVEALEAAETMGYRCYQAVPAMESGLDLDVCKEKSRVLHKAINTFSKYYGGVPNSFSLSDKIDGVRIVEVTKSVEGLDTHSLYLEVKLLGVVYPYAKANKEDMIRFVDLIKSKI